MTAAAAHLHAGMWSYREVPADTATGGPTMPQASQMQSQGQEEVTLGLHGSERMLTWLVQVKG